MSLPFESPDGGRESVSLGPGVFHLPGRLDAVAQVELARYCLGLRRGSASFYVPRVRGGGTMRLEMLCLGRHWNPMTYRYEATRADHDGLPTPPLEAWLARLARDVAAAVGMRLVPQVCLINHYGAAGRLGLHQDRDEEPETLAAGVPIVSVSLGDTARFLLGGLRRKAPVQTVWLRSGDAFVMGGEGRLRYHGVASILPDTGPAGLGIEGRVSLTFRQLSLTSTSSRLAAAPSRGRPAG